MSDVVRVQVLMPSEDAGRFEQFCVERGHKKSTLIARLIREHLDREQAPNGQTVRRQSIGGA